MPILTGSLDASGAVIEILIGVDRIRKSELLALGKPIFGGDLLAHCNFLYLGPERTFTLAF